MTIPTRIQCRRDRPWQTTPKAIVVSRPSRWGNTFRIGVDGDAATCVRLFEEKYETDRAYRAAVRAELGGKTLACWCRVGSPCHGDVLLRWANPTTAARAHLNTWYATLEELAMERRH